MTTPIDDDALIDPPAVDGDLTFACDDACCWCGTPADEPCEPLCPRILRARAARSYERRELLLELDAPPGVVSAEYDLMIRLIVALRAARCPRCAAVIDGRPLGVGLKSCTLCRGTGYPVVGGR